MATNMGSFSFDESPATNTGTPTSEPNLFDNPGNGAYRFGMNGDAYYAAASDKGNATSETIAENGRNARENLNQGSLNKAKNGDLYKENMQFGSNIPVDSPFANYNNMSWDQTQRLSRLADAYNARTRRKAGTFTADGITQMDDWQQNPQLQTEEMRRADLTRQGLGQQQAYALGRANEILAYPQKLNEMFDQAGLQADQAAMEINRNFADYARRAQYDMEFKAEFQQALQKDLLYWTQEMSQYQNGKVASMLYNEMASNPQYAQWLAFNLTNSVLPSHQQYLAGLVTNQIMRSSMSQNMDTTETYTAVLQMFNELTGVQAQLDAQQAAYSGKAAAGGFVRGLFGGKN